MRYDVGTMFLELVSRISSNAWLQKVWIRDHKSVLTFRRFLLELVFRPSSNVWPSELGTRHSRCRWQHFVMAITCINRFIFDRRPEYCWDHQCQNQEITYILIDWVGGPNGKILSSRSWRASRSRKMQKNSISARPDGFDRTGSHQPVRPCAR